MRSYLIWISFLLLFTNETQGHSDSLLAKHTDYRNYHGSELVMGRGVIASGQLFEGASPIGQSSYDFDHYTGALFIKYKFHKNRRRSYGVAVVYENESGTWNHAYRYGAKQRYYYTYLGHFKKQYFTVAPEMTINYFNLKKGFIKAYGTLGMGISYRDEVDTYDSDYYLAHYHNGINDLGNSLVLSRSHLQFNMYVSLLGIHVGRKFGGFMELGIGYRGLFNCGLTYKF